MHVALYPASTLSTFFLYIITCVPVLLSVVCSFVADHCGSILPQNHTPSRAEVWSETKIFVLTNIYKDSGSASLCMFMTSYHLPQ